MTSIEDLFPVEHSIHQLMEVERELDARIIRRQLSIADASFKTNRVKRVLKVEPSHHVERYGESFLWTLTINGLLDQSQSQHHMVSKPTKPVARSFSSLLNKLVVVATGEDGASRVIFEWTKTPSGLEVEHFEIRETSAVVERIELKIILQVDSQPERFRVSQELQAIAQTETGTTPQLVLAIWQYVKAKKLQESDEKKIFGCDDTLRQLFGISRASFSDIPTLLRPHMLPLEPIELGPYVIDLRTEEGITSSGDLDVGDSDEWEVPIEVDEPGKPRIGSAGVVAMQREVSQLEQKLTDATKALYASRQHEEILLRFAKDPIGTLQQLMAVQTADKAMLLGEPSFTVNDLLSSSTFSGEEMERIVTYYTNTVL